MTLTSVDAVGFRRIVFGCLSASFKIHLLTFMQVQAGLCCLLLIWISVAVFFSSKSLPTSVAGGPALVFQLKLIEKDSLSG